MISHDKLICIVKMVEIQVACVLGESSIVTMTFGTYEQKLSLLFIFFTTHRFLSRMTFTLSLRRLET